jgi:hypothetical protein
VRYGLGVKSEVLHALPVLAIVGVIFLIYSRKGNHPPTYTLSEPWTHAPILWAATAEVVPGSGHDDAHHGGGVNVGGGASGRW